MTRHSAILRHSSRKLGSLSHRSRGISSGSNLLTDVSTYHHGRPEVAFHQRKSCSSGATGPGSLGLALSCPSCLLRYMEALDPCIWGHRLCFLVPPDSLPCSYSPSISVVMYTWVHRLGLSVAPLPFYGCVVRSPSAPLGGASF